MALPEPIDPLLRDLPGAVLEGRYRVDELIAVGGMSYVFRGYHLSLHRAIAIKVLDPARSGEHAGRFTREAESAARLDHPNCIHIYDYGTTVNGLHYMVMPLLLGESLAQRLTRDAMSVEATLTLALQLFRGLEHAHGHGVIHRDLKPENLFVAKEGDAEILKIVDFGIAKFKTVNPELANATMSGLMSGTPGYMSPEQALGLETDERTDLYSAGLVMYRLLTGSLPFEAPDPVVTLQRQMTEDVPPLPTTVPASVTAVIDRLLAKERDGRLPSATETLRVLEGLNASAAVSGQFVAPNGFASGKTEVVPPEPPPMPQPTQVAVPQPFPVDAETSVYGRRRMWGVMSVGAAALLLVAAMAWPIVSGSNDDARQAAVVDAGDRQPAVVQPGSVPAPVDAANSNAAPNGAAAPGPAADDVQAMLDKLNTPEFDRAPSFEERHRLLEAVALAGQEAAVDRRSNLALDLIQASQSKTPCATFRAALAEIDSHQDRYFDGVLQRAVAPSPMTVAGAGSPPDGSCDGLDAALARASGTEVVEEQPALVATNEAPKPRDDKRAKRRKKAGSKRAPSKPPKPAANLPRKSPPRPAAGSSRRKAPPAEAPVRKLGDGLKPLK